MADQGDDKLLEHSYDGIQEYDNPMPRWWVWVFWATIVFSVAYYFLPAPFGKGPGNVAEYEAAMAAANANRPQQTAPQVSDDALLRLVADEEALEEGKEVFAANCAACHRADGGGLIGPNLTDEAWIHGGAPTQVHHTIRVGVLEKGMPPWERILKPEQLDHVTAYVLSLKGSNPPNPKAPEGPAAAPAAPTSGT